MNRGLAPKRKKGRAKLPRCTVRGCDRIARVFVAGEQLSDGLAVFDLYCPKHAKLEADKWARQIVMARDLACQRCGATEGRQWAHVIRRGSPSVRWLADGAMALCPACHVYMTHREEEWRTWLDANRPGLWERLNAIRIEAADKRTQPDLAEIIASLRSQAAGLVR